LNEGECIMRKSWQCAIVLWLISGGNVVSAQDGSRKLHVSLDMYMPGNVHDALLGDIKKFASDLVANGSTAATYSVATSQAIGGSVGVLYPRGETLNAGLKLGYIAGPVSVSKVMDDDPGIGKSYQTFERDISFVTGLASARHNFSSSGKWSWNGDIGVGVGLGSVVEKVTQATNGFAGNSGNSVKANWSGLAWEAGLTAGYQLSGSLLTFGIKYAGFPGYKGDTAKGLSKIDWTTAQFSIGLQFGGGGDDEPVYSRRSEPEERRRPEPQASEPLPVEEPEEAESFESRSAAAAGLLENGDYAAAIGAYDEAIELLPEGDRREIQAQERKGFAASKIRDWKAARQYYIAAIGVAKAQGVKDKSVLNAYLGLAYAFEKSGNAGAAVRNYEKALTLTRSAASKGRIRAKIQALKAASN
jgi:hypothetical protein